jgi:thiol-disulfide isomerase/thioredoxin
VIAIAIYSRPGCHLCEEMKAVVQNVAQRENASVTIDEIDISTDPALESRYGLEIPVLIVEGRKVAKYRISEQELMRIIRDRADRSDRSDGSRGSDGSVG